MKNKQLHHLFFGLGLVLFATSPFFAQETSLRGNGTSVSGTLHFRDEQGHPQPLARATVRLTDDQGTVFYGSSDSNGYYEVQHTGKDASLEICPTALAYYFDTTTLTYDIPWSHLDMPNDFELGVSQYCPFLYTDISTPHLQACQPSYYVVSYRNEGTSTAVGAYVDIELDSYLRLDSSEIAATSLGNHRYRMQLGTLPIGAMGSFRFYVFTDCDAPLGATHCVEAHIYPDVVCDSLWNGALLNVDAQCAGDSIEFMIYNGGTPYNGCPYIVIEDDIMLMQGSTNVGNGQTVTVIVPRVGTAYRIEVQQELGFPSFLGDPIASAVIEGCGSGTQFQPGFVNQFSNNSSSPFIATDCQANNNQQAAYLKQAFPEGYSEAAYIYPYTELDYHLYFESPQPSQIITIYDTISPHLDITTLEPGASSHPYTWSVVGNTILVFRLDNSGLNGTTGFVKYRLSQQPNNPVGTEISGKSLVQFDGQQPRPSNRVVRIVGESFLQVWMGNSSSEANALSLAVYPNPLREVATLHVQGNLPQGTTLYIVDALGRSIAQQPIDQPEVQLQRSLFPAAGLYFFRIEAQGETLAQGKLQVF